MTSVALFNLGKNPMNRIGTGLVFQSMKRLVVWTPWTVRTSKDP